MKKYHTFISADPDGVITGYHTTLVDEEELKNHPRPYKITNEEYRLIKVYGHEKLYYNYESGCLHFKPEVKLTLDKPQIKSDGTDAVKVNVEQVPENIEELEIMVGGDIGVIDPKIGVEVTCDTPQSLFIKITDKRVYCDYIILEVIDAA